MEVNPYYSSETKLHDRSMGDLQNASARRRLHTAGNPIGIMDQSERFSFRPSMTGGT